MNKTRHLAVKIGFLLCGALLGSTTYGQISIGINLPSVEIGIPAVQIQTESDFYAPLAASGRWENVGSYGQCWIPGGVEADWRPYSSGSWQLTDAGWFWVSDEPWAWATYHYGRWNMSPEFGWYWMPQTQWAPSWVSWHSGGGYIGWAPMYPSGVTIISPQAYVFVREANFMNPVSRSTIVVNITTIINNTRIVTKGPTAAAIEKATGRKIKSVPVQQLRHKEEATVAAKQKTQPSTSEKTARKPARAEKKPVEEKTVVPRSRPELEKPVAVTHESETSASKKDVVERDARKPVSSDKEIKPLEKKSPQPAKVKPVTSEKAEPNPSGHENKDKE